MHRERDGQGRRRVARACSMPVVRSEAFASHAVSRPNHTSRIRVLMWGAHEWLRQAPAQARSYLSFSLVSILQYTPPLSSDHAERQQNDIRTRRRSGSRERRERPVNFIAAAERLVDGERRDRYHLSVVAHPYSLCHLRNPKPSLSLCVCVCV